ncbi:MAG: 3'(2'),5'-bisphosphate nucleotidase CysQ [Flammeovirgaceae bacterium]
MNSINIQEICDIAVEAGKQILAIYTSKDFGVENKADDSPLTLADRASHLKIVEGLEQLDQQYPILSEEGDPGDFELRKAWKTFWCVDPLDGTKEFIKRNGEFTVNIALIDGNFPVLGVIYVPVTDTLYYASAGKAFKKTKEGTVQLQVSSNADKMVAVGSRSHSSEEEKQVLELFGIEEVASRGSSLKFCMVAEGKATVYYRRNPTMEWDTAAGQAIVEASGGAVLNKANTRFNYNKTSLRNDSFLCLGAKTTDLPWNKI